MAGCSGADKGAFTGTQRTVPALVPASPVAPSEWKAVMADWHDDRVFDRPHLGGLDETTPCEVGDGVTSTCDPGHGDGEDVRGDACAAGVAADGRHWRVLAVLRSGLRHATCPNLLHRLILGRTGRGGDRCFAKPPSSVTSCVRPVRSARRKEATPSPGSSRRQSRSAANASSRRMNTSIAS